jgi:hypothetical protein
VRNAALIELTTIAKSIMTMKSMDSCRNRNFDVVCRFCNSVLLIIGINPVFLVILFHVLLEIIDPQ